MTTGMERNTTTITDASNLRARIVHRTADVTTEAEYL